MNIIEDYQQNYSTGYLGLYRSLKNKGWYKKSEYVHLWIHLLILATHKEHEFMFNGVNIKLEPGQLVTGRKKLSTDTGINESKIERILNFFEKNEHQIEQQKTNRNRLITIVSWCNYQITEQQIEQPVNNKRTTSEQQVNTYNNEKNIKNDNNLTWRNDFSTYIKDCREGYKKFMEDNDKIKIQERLNPNVNVKLSIEKGFVNFWGKEAGWKHKKKSKSKSIDWENTIINSIGMNKVYLTKAEINSQ